MAKNIPSKENQRPATKTTFPARLSIKIEGQIKSFPDKRSLKEYIHFHQTSSARDAKGTALRKGRKRVIEEHRYEKMAMNKYLSIITLNINGLNAPIKRHSIAEWIRKHDPHICCLQETNLRTKDLHKLKGLETNFPSKRTGKKAGVAILIRQNRLQKKGHKETPRRSLHNTQRKNPPRRHIHCKYI